MQEKTIKSKKQVVDPEDLVKFPVRGDSNTHDLALKYVMSIKEGIRFEIQAISMKPINQAIKGIAKAIQMLAREGIYVAVRPVFKDAPSNHKEGETISVMTFSFIRV
ncbi:MAG: stage V sporulation protein S [Candidatus Kariarchaeaceae archaeon]